MSEQAQTSAAAKAPPPQRVRPSRAKGARPNGAHPANGAAATASTQAAEHEQVGPAAAQESQQTMVSGTQESLQSAADSQAGDQQATDTGQGAEAAQEQTETLSEEEQKRRAEQLQNALLTYRAHMMAGGTALDRVLEAVADITTLLKLQPGQYADMDAHIQKAGQGLATFRANLVTASSLGVEPYLTPEDTDLAGWLAAAVNSLKEYRRRIDGKIAIMETDVGNTTAILAIERTINEQRLISGICEGALAKLLAKEGFAR
jgi:hypothetical protein